jgi:hypothetical protein
MKLVIIRSNFDSQTLGNMLVLNDTDIVYQCKTLELPDINNTPRVSCIPEGRYQVVKHVSPKHGACFWVKNVPNRNEILIHQANFKSQLQGCIAVGRAHTDINGDKLRDVTDSNNTMITLLKLLPSEFYLHIINIAK